MMDIGTENDNQMGRATILGITERLLVTTESGGNDVIIFTVAFDEHGTHAKLLRKGRLNFTSEVRGFAQAPGGDIATVFDGTKLHVVDLNAARTVASWDTNINNVSSHLEWARLRMVVSLSN
jgi:hypothetical protein